MKTNKKQRTNELKSLRMKRLNKNARIDYIKKRAKTQKHKTAKIQDRGFK